jgi:hypothetical protein
MVIERWIARTPSGRLVRLSEAAWIHKILISHPEFDDDPAHEQELRLTLEDPEVIVEGWEGELLSLRWCTTAPKGPKYLCVVYREAEPVGFVITAFFISRYGKLLRRKRRWQKRP